MNGQGALEYLMTYGWALLVIVVVGATLYAIGVLNPQTYSNQPYNQSAAYNMSMQMKGFCEAHNGTYFSPDFCDYSWVEQDVYHSSACTMMYVGDKIYFMDTCKFPPSGSERP